MSQRAIPIYGLDARDARDVPRGNSQQGFRSFPCHSLHVIPAMKAPGVCHVQQCRGRVRAKPLVLDRRPRHHGQCGVGMRHRQRGRRRREAQRPERARFRAHSRSHRGGIRIIRPWLCWRRPAGSLERISRRRPASNSCPDLIRRQKPEYGDCGERDNHPCEPGKHNNNTCQVPCP